MTIPLPFFTQYECRNETLEVYAQDRRGIVNYQFNNLGYRNCIDYDETDSDVAVYLGSSITAGIGLDWSQSFAQLSSQALEVKCYQLAQGCMEVDNEEILRMLIAIKKSNLGIKHYILQFISLERQYDYNTGVCLRLFDHDHNVARFVKVFDQVQALLNQDSWCFIGCDELQHHLPDCIIKHDNCVAWNPVFIDLNGYNNHPGRQWHKMMALAIVKKLRKR